MLDSPSTCTFHGCANAPAFNSIKCTFHRHRAKCSVATCVNQVYARGYCVRHGGKRRCAVVGCDGNARAGPHCCKHSHDVAKKRLCGMDGCRHVARARGRCVSHGGGRECSIADCTQHVRRGGVCRRHTSSSPTLASSEATMEEGFKILASTTESFEDDALDMAIVQVLLGQPTSTDLSAISIDSVTVGLDKWVLETILCSTACVQTE
ncbi:Aste57867_12878 [Aphanomyces stellatus]|uniref:Aste57867_12878 protein n=1 Tax=Aphanomyces stellatus TaxID=120398 RepID=A0A485KXE5_9STRA|nr:hypothetical protein As57867_012830 [Aphanomyces stellatus]VFT89725.1 Aste57867_12878 [Aphanomyces stellatus]